MSTITKQTKIVIQKILLHSETPKLVDPPDFPSYDLQEIISSCVTPDGKALIVTMQYKYNGK